MPNQLVLRQPQVQSLRSCVGESRYAHPFLAEARSRKRLFNHCQTQSKSQSNLTIEIHRSESACSDQSRLNTETQINLTKRLTSKRSLQRFSSAKTASSESSFSHSNSQFNITPTVAPGVSQNSSARLMSCSQQSLYWWWNASDHAVAAKKLWFKFAADRRLACIAWFCDPSWRGQS